MKARTPVEKPNPLRELRRQAKINTVLFGKTIANDGRLEALLSVADVAHSIKMHLCETTWDDAWHSELREMLADFDKCFGKLEGKNA